MTYQVSTFNSESGWSLGTFLSHAATEAEAIDEAAKRYGVEGLTGFRHVATSINSFAEEAKPVIDAVQEVAPVVEVVAPETKPEVDAAEGIANALKQDDSLLAKVAALLRAGG